MTDSAQRFTPAEIQQQLIQCTDLLHNARTGNRIDTKAAFLRNWYDTLISARTHYLEREHLTEAQWNVLASEGLE